MNAQRVFILLLGIALVGSLIACDSNNGPTSPALMNQGQGMGVSPGPGAGPATGSLTPVGALDPAVTAAMNRAIQDEYHAEEIYLAVLEDFGSMIPFVNVVHAEERHSMSISRLYSNRGMSIPASEWNRDNVPRFASAPEACAAAVTAEEENINMYDEFLRMELPYDVDQVFTNNRRASLENHLPAFQFCAGL